jgi:hypothetical protein
MNNGDEFLGTADEYKHISFMRIAYGIPFSHYSISAFILAVIVNIYKRTYK